MGLAPLVRAYAPSGPKGRQIIAGGDAAMPSIAAEPPEGIPKRAKPQRGDRSPHDRVGKQTSFAHLTN